MFLDWNLAYRSLHCQYSQEIRQCFLAKVSLILLSIPRMVINYFIVSYNIFFTHTIPDFNKPLKVVLKKWIFSSFSEFKRSRIDTEPFLSTRLSGLRNLKKKIEINFHIFFLKMFELLRFNSRGWI